MENFQYYKTENKYSITDTNGKLFFTICEDDKIKCNIQYSEKNPNIHLILNKFFSIDDELSIKQIRIDFNNLNIFSEGIFKLLLLINFPVGLEKIILNTNAHIYTIDRVILVKYRLKLPFNTVLKLKFVGSYILSIFGSYILSIKDTDTTDIIYSKIENLMSIYHKNNYVKQNNYNLFKNKKVFAFEKNSLNKDTHKKYKYELNKKQNKQYVKKILKN